MDKFTESSAKDGKGNMRVNCSNVFQTGQELFNCNMFSKDELLLLRGTPLLR